MVPKLFGTGGQLVLWKIIFPWAKLGVNGSEMIQAHCMYCALYFYYY